MTENEPSISELSVEEAKRKWKNGEITEEQAETESVYDGFVSVFHCANGSFTVNHNITETNMDEKEYNRDNFPLEVGEVVTIDGKEAELVDTPTDGPLFEWVEETEPGFEHYQMEWSEVNETLDLE